MIPKQFETHNFESFIQMYKVGLLFLGKRATVAFLYSLSTAGLSPFCHIRLESISVFVTLFEVCNDSFNARFLSILNVTPN
jgi:hypothetical protein